MKKYKNIDSAFNSILLIIAFTFSFFQSYSQQLKPAKSGYVNVGATKIYFEEYGKGTPMVLLHGAFMTIGTNWSHLLPELSKKHRVIAIEMQGHGHSPVSERKYSYPTMADDVNAVMAHLNIDSAAVIGYSFGGTVAYQLAIAHPRRVKELVVISSVYKYTGMQKELIDILQVQTPEFLADLPYKADYMKVAPDTTKWSTLLTQFVAFDKEDYNLGEENIKNIKCPVLLIFGDNDWMDKIELIKTYQLLGGCLFTDKANLPKSQLAILPGQEHISVMMETKTILELLNSFLKQK